MTYQPPTPAEARALLDRWELTSERAGALLDYTGSGVRRWTCTTRGVHRPMPYSCLYVLACEVDAVRIRPGTWRDALLA